MKRRATRCARDQTQNVFTKMLTDKEMQPKTDGGRAEREIYEKGRELDELLVRLVEVLLIHKLIIDAFEIDSSVGDKERRDEATNPLRARRSKCCPASAILPSWRTYCR